MTVTVQAAVNASEAAINGTMAAAPTAAETVLSVSRHDMQAYGIITTICLCLIVFGGVHLVDRVGSLFIIPAVLAVISVFIGIFLSPDAESPGGPRADDPSSTTPHPGDPGDLSSSTFSSLRSSQRVASPDGYNESDADSPGAPCKPPAAGALLPGSHGHHGGKQPVRGAEGRTAVHTPTLSYAHSFPHPNRSQLLGLFYPGVTGIMAGSNRQLLGLFYPGVTGIMAGSNRSEALRDTLDCPSVLILFHTQPHPSVPIQTIPSHSQLLGLFYPGVTGIMAGSNRSEALRDTQRSIPTGTLAAIVSMTGLYVVSILLFGAVATRDLLVTDRLLTATIAWPVPAVVQVGIVLSTLGAALQNLMGAPRLLAAIANDNVLPVLNAFKAESHQEPHLATLFTLLLCCSFVLIGDVDYVSPVITMFFLLCYCGVNLSCALLDLVDAPSWRPRWRWHHWLVSLAGALLCLVIMYLISWFFTLVCLTLAVLIYIYVSMVGKAGDWGDGVKSAYMQLALRSLHFLGGGWVSERGFPSLPLCSKQSLGLGRWGQVRLHATRPALAALPGRWVGERERVPFPPSVL
ncbi:unnamed protein product [Closterium sp. Yama58-4]|nr:unnamed protein product [Closterium sp. Yama58-4]